MGKKYLNKKQNNKINKNQQQKSINIKKRYITNN